MDTIVKELEHTKEQIRTSFIVSSTEYLARSGRISERINAFCHAFMIRPVIVLKKSRMKVGALKVGTRSHAWKKYISATLNKAHEMDKRTLFITYAGLSTNELKEIDKQVRQKADFAPMEYSDGDGGTGFDAELAEAFAESLDVTLEFVEINWEQKTELLQNGKIDCIWNGMTKTEELQEIISCSEPYLSNAQVVVLRSNEMKQYSTVESCQHFLFAVEAGSTGEKLLKEMKYRYTSYPTQMEALQSVHDKKADAAVIDIIMASYYIGDRKEFVDFGFDISLNDEVISVGLRNNSDLTEKLNIFLKNAYEDGTIDSLARKYGIESAVLDFEDK